jgi:hypothetical protein
VLHQLLVLHPLLVLHQQPLRLVRHSQLLDQALALQRPERVLLGRQPPLRVLLVRRVPLVQPLMPLVQLRMLLEPQQLLQAPLEPLPPPPPLEHRQLALERLLPRRMRLGEVLPLVLGLLQLPQDPQPSAKPTPPP